MAFKFFSIGKANARIDELEAQVAALEKDNADLRAASEGNGVELAAELETTQKNLATVESQLTEIKATIAAKDAELAKAKADLEAKEKEVEVRISRGLAERQAELGQPTPPVAPASAAAPTHSLFGLDRVIAFEKSQSQKKN